MLIHNSSFEVRNVTENDLEAVLEVYRQSEDFLALGPEPKASMSMVQKDLEISRREGGCFCGIYQADGKMVGVVDFVPKDFEGEDGVAFISLLMIAAPFRSRGLGAKIVELIEGEMTKDSRLITIRAAVQTNNSRALRFWHRNGYRIIGSPELRPDRTMVYYLQKEINKEAHDLG